MEAQHGMLVGQGGRLPKRWAARAATLCRPALPTRSVSSAAHLFGHINFEDINSERSYSRWGAYGQRRVRAVVVLVDAGPAAIAQRPKLALVEFVLLPLLCERASQGAGS